RITAYRKGEPNLQVSEPVDRKSGMAETPVALHVPSASATLNLSVTPPDADPSRRLYITLQSENAGVRIAVVPELSQPRTFKLPPGTYRVMDMRTEAPLDGIDPIAVKEGESTTVELDHARI